MHRCQVHRWLTHDEFGCTLEEELSLHRLEKFFHYFGASIGDVVLNAAYAFSIDIPSEMDLIDRNIVFLSKFANLDARWVEEQDVMRQNRLVRITMDFVNTQRTTVAFDDDSDEPPDS